MPVVKEELGRRLKAARESARMTQQQVATELKLNRTAVTQLESGDRAVSSTELAQLAYLYGRDMAEFFASEFSDKDALAALFRAEPSMAEREDIAKTLRDCVAIAREQTNLEELLEIDRAWAVANYACTTPTRKGDAIRQGERVAEEERQRLGLGTAPIENLPELLESDGIRTRQISLAEEVSGFTMNDPKVGPFIVINAAHKAARKRYSLAHEYAHVLMDKQLLGVVSRQSQHAELLEMRANSFAANFLMPEKGVRQFLASLGKERVTRTQAQIFDGESSVNVDVRSAPNRAIQLYDVVQLASHFGVSRPAVLYRLLNLGIITSNEQTSLAQQNELAGRQYARLMGVNEDPLDMVHLDSNHRFVGLALEALRREEISDGKFKQLARMVGIAPDELEALALKET